MSDETHEDIRRPERRQEIEQEPFGDAGPKSAFESLLRQQKSVAQALQRAVVPRPIEAPRFELPDIDIARSIAETKQADRDALSAIIERHTGVVRRAVDSLNQSSQEAANNAQMVADSIRRWTLVLAGLIVIIAIRPSRRS